MSFMGLMGLMDYYRSCRAQRSYPAKITRWEKRRAHCGLLRNLKVNRGIKREMGWLAAKTKAP
jgi:hypothetical protein